MRSTGAFINPQKYMTSCSSMTALRRVDLPQYFGGKDSEDSTDQRDDSPSFHGNRKLDTDECWGAEASGELTSMQLMLTQKPLEGSSLLACGFGGMRDIAVMDSEQIDEVGPLEFLHGSHFRLA